MDAATAEESSDSRPEMRAAWLAVAVAFLLFANGRHSLAFAAWLAPIFLLRFTRSTTAGKALGLTWLAFSAAFSYQFLGMVPLPTVGYVVLALVYGLVETVPFALDRLLAQRLGKFRATFILPCAWVVTEFLVATLTPYGSWGSAAYSQYENLALLQMMSVTGLYGVSFLIAWSASVVNWVWELDFDRPAVSRGVVALGTVVGGTILLGGARLALFPPSAMTVRVASLTAPDIELFATPEIRQRAMTNELTDEELEDLRSRSWLLNEDLLRRSRREARAGARIVFWGESNAFALKADEAELLERSVALARDEGIYLGLGAAVWDRDNDKPLENKLVLIDPEGTIAWQTLKAIPIPGPEAAISATDDGRLKSLDSPHGRLSAVICFDMDFPGLLKQAGRLQADVVLVPSNDWREIDPWHSHMARFRAIEQGFNLVRHTSGGLSVAADYQGRVLASMDHYTTEDRSLVAYVPTEGSVTVYSRVGDLFAALCAAGLTMAAAVSLRKS